jgi:uncharacterized RDD family membrane protein YckC
MTRAPPAGFWHRCAAWSLDFTLLGLLATALSWSRLVAGWHASVAATGELSTVLQSALGHALEQGQAPGTLSVALLGDPAVIASADAMQSALLTMSLSWLMAYAVIGLLYHVGFEQSPWQGSPGKHALRLRVVDAAADGPVALYQSIIRYVAGALSWLTLNLGHALAAVPPQKRALHDYLSSTRVTMPAEAPPRLPGWARAWLWLQLVAYVLPLLWLVQHATAALQAGLLGTATG